MPKKVVIKGKVHGVGLRIKLIQLALEYGIDKFNTFNTLIDKKQAVVCLIDAPDQLINIFVNRIQKEKPEKAIFESITVDDYKFDVPPIERCLQTFQMEHWGKAIPILIEIRDAIREESEKTRQTVKEESEKIRLEAEMLRKDLRSYIEVSLREIQSRIERMEKALKRAGIM